MRGRIETVASGPQVNPRLILRGAQANAGLRWFLTEAGRNAILHGLAKSIKVEIERSAAGDLSLVVLDDGIGMDADARDRFGTRLGYSVLGNGSGVRVTAYTLAQYLEAQTIFKGEPDVVYFTKMPVVKFITDVCSGTWRGSWQTMPIDRSRLVGMQAGTAIVLSDFRASHPDDPMNPARMRSTVAQITIELARRYIPQVFPPDQARLFTVNGQRVQPRPFEGYLLWKEELEQPGLGRVNGEVRLSETGSGNWLLIGGSTATVPIMTFVAGFDEHNPELGQNIPAVLRRERRLTGLVRIDVLERFSTPDRGHFLADFYSSPEAVMVIDELTRVATKMKERLREYDEEPHTHVTESLLRECIARVHAVQGIGEGSQPAGASGSEVVLRDAPQRLIVSPVLVHLEPWDGKGERDRVVLAIMNPMSDEEFDWDDHGQGLIVDRTGCRVTIQAIKQEGNFLITVRSRLYRNRECTIHVTMRHIEALPASDVFRLSPMATTVCVGEERVIRIKHVGSTSGKYNWTVDPTRVGNKEVVLFTIMPGGREVKFVARRHGRFTITCVDAKDGAKRATCRVEVLAKRDEPEDTPTPAGGGEVGTGHPVATRKSGLVGSVWHFRFNDRDYAVRLITDPTLEDPFLVEPENGSIRISDKVRARFESDEASRRHIAACMAEGIAFVLQHEGALSPDDHVGFVELASLILNALIPSRSLAENGSA